MRLAPLRIAALTAVVGLSLTSCGGDDGPDVTISSGRPTPSSTASTPADDSADDIITLGSSPGSLEADQQEVLDAYVAYWQVRAAAYRAARIDPDALGRVASGQAASSVAVYVSGQQAEKRHTEGKTTLRVSDVAVDGDSATVSDCLDDRSADVSDDSGKPVERPGGDTGITASMQRVSGSWFAVDVRADDSC